MLINNTGLNLALPVKSAAGRKPLKTCNTCSIPLHSNFIDCCECEANLCFNCFRRGKELKDHRSYHKYSIVRTDFNLLDKNWTADEECRLLDCVLDCGYGNWQQIAKFFKNKDTASIQQHFNKIYVENPVSELAPRFSETREVLSTSLPIPALGPADNPPRPTRKFGNVIKELADYNPARGEFGVDYDNRAEAELLHALGDSQLVTTSNQSNDRLTTELSLALLDSYTRRLKRRARIKSVVKQYALVSKRRAFSHTLRYKNVKCASWSWARLNVFCQLITSFEMDYLMEGLLLESSLKCNILKLQTMRQHGLRALGSAGVMEDLTKVREEHVRQLSCNLIPGDSTAARLSRLIPPGNLSDWNLQNIARLSQPSSKNAGISVASVAASGHTTRRSALPLDILGLQGYEHLSLEEKQLCSTIRIIPQVYLDVKALLGGESEGRGGLRLADARQLVKIDVNKTRKLYDFFMKEGIIKPPPPQVTGP